MEEIHKLLIPWILLKPALTPEQRTQLLAAIDVTLTYKELDTQTVQLCISLDDAPVSFINLTKDRR